MATKRFRNGRWEYVVKRKALLPNPLYFYFSTEAEGDEYVRRLEHQLDAGIVPQDYKPSDDRAATLADLMRTYQVALHVPDDDRALLGVLTGRIGKVRLLSINYEWAEAWVAGMKRELNLAPGTIRHHVGALRRCFDWASRSGKYPELVPNPLTMLPKRYSAYTPADAAYLQALGDGDGVREDEYRDQRVEEAQEIAIRAVLGGAKHPDRQRALELEYQAALECVFDIAIESAMRMREIYTLGPEQVDVSRVTFFLDKTKNGDKRQVPMTSVAKRAIETYLTHVEAGTRGMAGFKIGESIFPWWDGDRGELRRVTSLLSRQFSRIFDTAKCGEIRFHDLRHEATSRLYERTQLTDLQIAKITGHKDPKVLARYANLRASNLAAHLW